MLQIRRAHSGDAETLAELARSAYAHYVTRMGREPAPMQEDYHRLIRETDVWVAEEEASVVGLLALYARPNHMLLSNIAVSPRVQNRGVGIRLLEFAEAEARKHNLPELRLYTNEAMTENIGYYARRGYVETYRGTEKGYNRVYFVKHL